MKKLIKNIVRYLPLIAMFSLFTIFNACKKLVTVDPPITKITESSVFTTDANAISVLTGIYAQMMNSGINTNPNILSGFAGLSADEFSLFSNSNATYLNFYSNALTNSDGSTGYAGLWQSSYRAIFTLNSAIEELPKSKSLTPSIQQQLIGEAKFMRAFYYFYLTNLYGDVPLVVSTDYTKNATASRSPQPLIYQQIISDLNDAKNLLSPNYLDGTLLKISADRLRPTQWAADALLARVYLYYGNLTGDATNYTQAFTYSNTVINNSSLFGLSTLSSAFLKASSGNKESVLQIQPVHQYSVDDAILFVLPPSGPSPNQPIYVNNNLVSSFESGDNRKSTWLNIVTVGGITYYYAFKYKNNTATTAALATEHLMVLRLAEQYLIRAEAQADGAGNGTIGAITDLNVIRNRAGLPNYNGLTDKASVIAAIFHERQVELFSEWGHRWLDMKRLNLANNIMPSITAQKGGAWSSFKQLYPVPASDISSDTNLSQNSGY
jgi:hypothetical protein